jgi:hypothetical protein
LDHHFGKPIFEHCPLFGRSFDKGETHSEVLMGIDHFSLALEDALVPDDAQLDYRPVGKGI